MWTYSNKNGALTNATATVAGIGYSGKLAGKNNPAMQNVEGVGPIPVGQYSIGAPFDSPTHGPFAMHLTPAATNEMFGRSAFLMHGDSVAHPGMASEGCIIMSRTIREAVWNSGDHSLQVV